MLGALFAAAHADETTVDETVEVTGEREATESARSQTRITNEELADRQAPDLYDALANVPGVAVEGGPRTSGKSLSIRGFSDNEDVLIRIDGATQNFEKYRFGSGLNLDPELVKQIDVLRGAATLTQGAGALGGVVLVETVDAADLLTRDARFGALAKLGYTTNDDGQQRAITTYGRPHPSLDLLASVVSRDTHNYELPDATRLQNSAEAELSGLMKAELMREWGEIGISHRRGEQEGLEPFDATGGAAGIGGTVRRATTDESTVLRGALIPGWTWLEADATLGYTHKNVTDLDSEIAGGAARGTDVFNYDIWTLDLRNVSQFEIGASALRFEYGIQGNRETRAARRTNLLGTVDNQAQPPGSKETWGAFAAQALRLGSLKLELAARIDQVNVTAKSNSANLLEAQGRASKIVFSKVSPAVLLSYTPLSRGLTLFYSYFEAFRPPLIDEYFTIGSLSRCQFFSRFVPPPTAPTLPVRPARPGPRASFPNLTAFLAALDAFRVALDAYTLALDAYFAQLELYLAAEAAYPSDPNAQANALCGGDYEPEIARTHEIGSEWRRRGLFDEDDQFAIRVSYFDTSVSNVLESIFENSVTGSISQPGIESRRGIEFSLKYAQAQWFVDMSLTTLSGRTDLRYYDNNINPLVEDFATPADRTPQALRDVPGDRIALTLGRRFWSDAFELGYRLAAIDARQVTDGFKLGCPAGFFVLPACTVTGTQDGYVLHGAYVRWSLGRHTTLRLAAENLANKSYLLAGFAGGRGTLAPGRDVRLNLEFRY